ncbi:Ig-like domain-containing protein, partial [Thiotrichales bacterium 19S9-12]|nr:Ig-like domain-containing protein [Thiotrichales bacterium 19S9-12]
DGATQTITIPVTVTDENGATDTQNLTITITGTNDAPVIDSISSQSATEAGSVVSGTITASDVDDNATLTFSGGDNVDGFSLNSDGSYSFDPTDSAYDHLEDGATQTITIPVTVTDENGATDTQNLTITITGTNDAPVANADTATTSENASITIDALANDTDLDASDNLIILSADIPTNDDGSVSIENNQLVFNPGTDFDSLAVGESREVTIHYTIDDGNGGSDNATITVTVTGTNDGPVANTDTATTSENASITIDALANDTDLDASDNLIILSADIPTNDDGSVSIENNKLVFNPGTDFDSLAVGESREVTIHYTIDDGNGGSDNATITVTVTGTNDTPVVTAETVSVDEGDSLVTGTMTATDADADAVLTFSTTETVDGFSLNSDGSYSFDPSNNAYDSLAEGDTQTITIPVTVTDENGATDTENLVITLTGTNDAPVVTAETVSVDEGDSLVTGTMTATDADADAVLTFSTTETVDGFSLNSDGSYSFDPSNNAYDSLAEGDTQTITIPVTVTDENGATDTENLVITLTGTNDAPVVTAETVSVDEGDSLVTGTMTATDADADAVLTFSTTETVDG